MCGIFLQFDDSKLQNDIEPVYILELKHCFHSCIVTGLDKYVINYFHRNIMFNIFCLCLLLWYKSFQGSSRGRSVSSLGLTDVVGITSVNHHDYDHMYSMYFHLRNIFVVGFISTYCWTLAIYFSLQASPNDPYKIYYMVLCLHSLNHSK